MFKQILSLSTALLLTLGFVACTADEPGSELEDGSLPNDSTEIADGPLQLKIKDAGQKEFNVYAADSNADYFVTVTKEGLSEEPAKVTLKVLDDKEFNDYRETFYGSADFKGVQRLNPDFFTLLPTEADSVGINSVHHTFKSVGNDYFAAKVVFDNQKIAEWRYDLEMRARATNQNKNPEEYRAALDTLNNFIFVVPVGLYSDNYDDSIAVADRYLVLTPKVENAVISVSVGNDQALIVEQDYEKLMDASSDYRNGSFGQELVKFSLPCANPYGFQIAFNNNADIDIARFNDHHTDMVLTKLPRRDENRELNYILGESNKQSDYIDFPAGSTEVWLPLEFFRNKIDAADLDNNYATSVQLKRITWNNSETPALVKYSVKLPESDIEWMPSGNGGHYDGYTFFVGYRVALQPLPLDGSSIIGANDPETTEGSFDALFDDDPSTFYHSAWSNDARKDRTPQYGSYLDFEIPTQEPVNAVAFKFTARVHSSPHSPKVIKLYYSNAKTEADREANWEPIFHAGTDEIKVSPTPNKYYSGSGQVTWLGGVKTDSDWIKAKEPFRYLRMCVIENAFDEKLTSIGTSSYGYWNLSELRLYGKIL